MKKAFTTVEMLVSITILAIGLLGLGVLFPMGMRSAMLTKQNSQAMEYCQQKIEYLRTLNYGNTELNEGTYGPDSLPFENTENVFALTYTVTDDYPVVDMKKIVVSVSWQLTAGTGGHKTRTQSITTYITR